MEATATVWISWQEVRNLFGDLERCEFPLAMPVRGRLQAMDR